MPVIRNEHVDGLLNDAMDRFYRRSTRLENRFSWPHFLGS